MLRAKQLPMVNTVWPGRMRNEGWISGHTSPEKPPAILAQRETSLRRLFLRAWL